MKSLEMNSGNPDKGVEIQRTIIREKGLKLTEEKWFYDALSN